ncbi:MAG: hypothetical protein EOO06_05050 [Chitinophagaceae bacterium]|nr:MAG: hypothetical protein EOO06_05050 [Chitinophagaceae bacterium]
MQIIPVDSPATQRQFLDVPRLLYRNDPNWIQPLDKDVEDVFDEKKNKAFRFGKVQRWLLKNDKNELIGRIAAFVNSKYKNKGDDVPVGGCGFFESIDSQDAANLLFDTAKHWLQQHGMEAMDGPINFGERDRWWGLVTKGFMEPLYCMNYNPEYYVKLFETYGFKLYFDQVCFSMKSKEPLSAKMWDRYNAIAKDPDFSAGTIKKNQLEKYADDFATVYNKAWAGHGGLKQLSKEQVLIMFKKMKPVMDERIVWFAYYKKDPIAIFVNLPDLNQWFKHLHGKFGLLQKLKFLWLKQFGTNRKFNGLVFGVVPEWHGKGVDAYMIGASAKVIQSDKVPYTDYEMQWIGDFNPKMLNIAASLGDVHRSRNLTTYRYLFNREKEFQRHPILV